MKEGSKKDRLDLATAGRLAKLASRPVDTSRLERKLEIAMGLESDGQVNPPPLGGGAAWWRPLLSVAAAVLIAVSVGWLVLQPGASTAMAAPAELAQIHFEVINSLTPHHLVSSVEEANQLLADQSAGFIELPPLPGTVQSCCLHEVAGETLTCALIEHDGQLITVAIAEAGDLHSPEGQALERNGRIYTIHKANGITMVMTNESGRWLCVMGEIEAEALVNIATEIEL